MLKIKYVLLLLTCTIGVLTEETNTEAQKRIDTFLRPPPNKAIQPIRSPPQEEPSFFSKVASWIFPFGGSDETPTEPLTAETRHRYAPQYLPPPLPPPHLHPGGHQGHSLPPPPPHQLPHQLPPQPQFHQGYAKQPCNPCNNEPWIPVAGTHGTNTVIGFVQQSHLQNQGHSPPPSSAYGPPSGNQGNLQDLHPPPLASQYGPPVSNQYGPPPSHPQYGAPKDQYGFSSNVNPAFGLPPENYRSPLQYIIPPPPSKYQNPSKYRPIPLKNINLQQQKFGPSKQAPFFYKQGIPKPNPANFKVNSPSHHGPPIPLNFDKPAYSQPPTITVSPLSEFKSPSANVNSFNTNLIPAPTLSVQPFNVEFVSPTPIPNYQQSLNNHYVSSVPIKYKPSPSPVTNIEQNVLGHSGINYPIPINNGPTKGVTYTDINFHQVIPTQNTQNYHSGFSSFDNLPQHGSKVEVKTNNNGQIATDVQVIPSIRVADYLASIEHPINVIQSPLVEVITSDTKQESHESDSSNNYGGNKVLLSENPVVVDDIHAAASAHNASYHNSLPQIAPKEEINHNRDLRLPILPYSPVENRNLNPNQNLHFPVENTNPTLSIPPTENYNLNPNPILPIPPSFHDAESQNSNPIPVFPSISPTFETLISSIGKEELRSESTTQKPLNYSSINQFIPHEFSQSSFGSNVNYNDQKSYKGIDNQSVFTQPLLDYSNWQPAFGSLSTSMIPPPIAEPVWLTAAAPTQQITSTTKKPKQVQIIIPYITNNHSSYLHTNTNLYKTRNIQQNANPKTVKPVEPTLITALPLFTQPPTVDEPVWSHYVTDHTQDGSNQVTATASTEKSIKTSVSSIRDLLLKEQKGSNDSSKALPFDIIRLQKNIDDWTQQEFSNSIVAIQKSSTSGKLVPSKNIPSEYLTTQPYNKNVQEVTTLSSILNGFFDHEAAGSNTRISTAESGKDIETNFIFTETTTFPTTTEILTTTIPPETTTPTKSVDLISNSSASDVVVSSTTPLIATPNPMWEKLQVSFSPLTKEKVYVVTPQPWTIIPKEINDKLLSLPGAINALTSGRFSVVIQPEGANKTKEVSHNEHGGRHIVFSEWPHIINNLITTTTTEKPKRTIPPLLGLMDLSAYTPPGNSTVETYAGHSRVITVVTPTTPTKKKTTPFEEKKSTTRTVVLYSTKP